LGKKNVVMKKFLGLGKADKLKKNDGKRDGVPDI
jgi:hypothetical protein